MIRYDDPAMANAHKYPELFAVSNTEPKAISAIIATATPTILPIPITEAIAFFGNTSGTRV